MEAPMSDDFQPLSAEVTVELPAEDTGEPPPPGGISEDRLREITQKACQLLMNYRAQMGLDLFPVLGNGYSSMSPVGREGTWTWIRQVSRFQYAGDYTFRRALGGVFLENGPNGGWSMNIPKRFISALATKAEDDLLGSDIFFSAMPENVDNPQEAKLSKQVETKIQRGVSDSNLHATLAESIRVALTEGERCVKVTYEVDKTQYIGDAEVMMLAGEPYRTPKGDYVFRKDNVLVMVVDQQGQFVRLAGPQEQLQPGEFIQSRLEKEPSVVMPEQPQFQLVQGLTLTITHKEGLRADGLFTEDFIYDIYLPTLADNKTMAHVYDMPKEDIEANFPGSGYNARLASMGVTGAMSQQSQPIPTAGEQLRVTYERELVNIHETYHRCRVNPQDEHESWLFLVIDMTNKVPIYSEYLGNMKMKRPPFGLLRGLRPQPGRAYGIGLYEDFRDKNLAIDITFNRLMLKDSKEGSVTFINSAMIKEVQEGHKLVIGGKEFYHLNAAYPDELGPKNPPVFRINLNEVDSNGWEIMDKLMASGVIEYGITDISSLSDTNAPIGKDATATATRNIERTGNLLQKSTQRMMAGDILGILDMTVDILLENMDAEEIAWVPGEQTLSTLNREEIRNLPRDIRLTLTRSKGPEVLQTNAQKTQLVMQYYGLSMALRKKVRTFFVNQLVALEEPDADETLEEPTDAEIQAEAAAQGNQPPETRESLALSLKDIGVLTPEERQQVLQKFGIQASPPEQVLALQDHEQQQEASLHILKSARPDPTPAPAQPAIA